MTTKPRHTLTLKDRLSRLDHESACRLLGSRGAKHIREGGQYAIDIDAQVYLGADLFRLSLPEAVVTITLMASARHRLHLHCTACSRACPHMGAALSLILEEKTALGLAAPPAEETPIEQLTDAELIERALEDRRERARTERMTLRSSDPSRPWTDYTITSAESGKSYRVALRGEERGVSYCSCPDFRKNTLGTCKHILHALEKVRKRFPKSKLRQPPRRRGFSVHVRYGETRELRLGLPSRLDDDAEPIVRPLRDRAVDDVNDLLKRVRRLERNGHDVTIYPDAEELIQQRLFLDRIASVVREIREDPAGHPLRRELLARELLPFQLDGIAFAVGAGRAILADDMGLGKTIQGIGVAELLAREAGIERVLVVCPASLKAQWHDEIRQFTDRSSQLVVGGPQERAPQYDNGTFFTICNYEQVLRDILAVEQAPWDLIILDEGQRIKNWEAKTSRVIKGLHSRFALVLTGTPLENRLDELYSVVEFVDDRRLGPGFRFFQRHRVVDERGKVVGYKNLGELREKLSPILLRRTREEVMGELPERTTEILRVAPTQEQLDQHHTHMQVVSTIVKKPFLTEMDLLRLQKSLLMCRMAADSTYLVDKEEPGYSSKLDELDALLERLAGEESRKIVLFSEWTTMIDRIEPLLEKHGLGAVRLDGQVPQKQRQQRVRRFNRDPECRAFLTTNAGATGLNLQAANTVINVDLPWNPAVLEQRISRAHRMGQEQPVHVFVLVTEQTLEENLLGTLSAKHDLALAALDPESEVEAVDLESGMEELKRRLEQLLGAKPEAPVDESARREAAVPEHKQRVAEAGGELVSAAFRFLAEIAPGDADGDSGSDAGAESAADPAARELRRRLDDCIDTDDNGRPTLTVTLPDTDALDALAHAVARFRNASS